MQIKITPIGMATRDIGRLSTLSRGKDILSSKIDICYRRDYKMKGKVLVMKGKFLLGPWCDLIIVLHHEARQTLRNENSDLTRCPLAQSLFLLGYTVPCSRQP